MKKSLARDHLELFGEQFWAMEMDNQACSLLQQSALHVSTLPTQFHSCISASQSRCIILWMFIHTLPDPLVIPRWEFWSAGEWTYTDCNIGNCQDIARRVKDRIEVQGGEVFQAKKVSQIKIWANNYKPTLLLLREFITTNTTKDIEISFQKLEKLM